jgi:SAM-dependent methyltransferase
MKHLIPTNLVHLYRSIRELSYRAISPFDVLFRKINRLEQYPPLYLRRHVSCLGSFDGPGYEFTAYLKLLLDLKTGQRIWDVGCGCGLLELALEENYWRGNLIGIDIHKPSIEWAQRTITRRVPDFQFVHSDIYNAAYAPTGKYSNEEWFANFRENDFDIAIAKSLFTHTMPYELDFYLQQISDRLKPTGKALLTFFLLTPEQASLRQANQISFTKSDKDSIYAVHNPAAPTAAVAYDEAYLIERLIENDLHISGSIHYGAWTGRKDSLSYQDIIVVTKQG